MGMKKRNISIISNQGTDSTELFKEYFDLLRIFLKVFLHEEKKPHGDYNQKCFAISFNLSS